MNLVIGNTSQLAHYFPEEYEKISSRNIDFEYFKNKFYDRIFFCFGENRTFLEDLPENVFFDTNVHYTYNLLHFFKDKCNDIIIYGSSELWNRYEGPIQIRNSYSYYYTPYIWSKHKMCNMIQFMREDQSGYYNVHIVHPFNFNSVYRKGNFLFGKIFHSILNKEKIEIGNTHFYRDLIHPKYVVERSIETKYDIIVGCGRLIFVNDFIRDLYEGCNLKYEDYVTENNDCDLKMKRNIFYCDQYKMPKIKYNILLEDTINDIKKLMI
jgi:nucleoside-diphosphate-sugar epimerase